MTWVKIGIFMAQGGKKGRRDGVSVFCADEVEPKWI